MSVMEDRAVEDDRYSDDDLDGLPDHAFHELQEKAFRSTQQQSTSVQPPVLRQLPRQKQLGPAPSFDRRAVANATVRNNDQHGYQPPSSDYGDFDDEMLDGEIYDAAEQPGFAAEHGTTFIGENAGESTQREQWRQQRYGIPPAPSRAPEIHLKEPKITGVPFINQVTHNVNYNSVRAMTLGPPEAGAIDKGPSQSGTDAEALQAQVRMVSSPS